VSDVSTAIMKLMEEGKMMEIESASWPKLKDCPDSMVSSSSLTFGSFWGLFVIVGVASSFALLIFVAMLMYEHRDFLSLKMGALWRKESEHDEGRGGNGTDPRPEESPAIIQLGASPNTFGPPPPSRTSVSEEEEFHLASEFLFVAATATEVSGNQDEATMINRRLSP